MKIIRLEFMNDRGPWYASDTITIREAGIEEMIAGTAGYLTTYIVERDGAMVAKVPGWAVEVRYEKE